MLQLPSSRTSLWRESYTASFYPALRADIETDVVIIGGGITGLTAAYMLKQAGLTVVVLEKDTIGGGTTGRTTGKVTSQHNLIYHDLYTRLGPETARLYGEANQQAVEQVAAIIKREKINCGWQRSDNYVYTVDPERVKSLRQEADTAARLGLPASFTTASPLPFAIAAAVTFANQGQLNAQQYLLGLARAIDSRGSKIYENSNVVHIKDGAPCRVATKYAKVTAKHVIVATNVPTLPLAARGGYCALEYPRESYIVVGMLPKNFDGMFIAPDKDQYSILPVKNGGQNLVLVGGESHISGLRGSTDRHYRRLADYAEAKLGVTKIVNRWSDRDYLSYDSLPLIGKLYPWSKHVHVGTAFMKWGLSNGTVAAMILRDLITGQPNSWGSTFDSTRLKPVRSIPRVIAQQFTGHY